MHKHRNLDDTLNHSLNTSISKATHKFSRADRFSKTYQSPDSYDLSNATTFLHASATKNTNWGFNRRFSQFQNQLRRKSLSPSPGTYQYQDGFKKSNNGIGNIKSFGVQKRFNKKDPHVPGPGKYQNRYNPQVSLSYTMRTRVSKNNNWNLVGPGQYNLNSSFSTLSSHRQTLNTKMGKQRRFNQKINTNPPPNAYQSIRTVTQPTSKYNETQKYSFSKNPRLKGEKLTTPGPGQYRQFSQFHEQELEGRW